MQTTMENTKYDEVLTSILVNEKSILGFLSTIFNFLARRTDFYYVPENPNENLGFPPGVAEELVLKVLRNCNPYVWTDSQKSTDINNEIMVSTVAQEVEVIAEDDVENVTAVNHEEHNYSAASKPDTSQENLSKGVADVSIKEKNVKSIFPEDYEPPIRPVQNNSEAYNGAVRESYTWSQTIMDLDVIIELPTIIKSAKDLKVNISPGELCVACKNGETIISDKLPYKIKTTDSFWSLSEGKLLMHLEKIQERWWNKLLEKEEAIDLDKIDCSRSLYELPEDHVAKVKELQWNQEQKLKGLPTSDDIRKMQILKKAWNADGSPFKDQPFDPNSSMFRPQ